MAVIDDPEVTNYGDQYGRPSATRALRSFRTPSRVRAVIQFRLFGIPVTVHPVFWLTLAACCMEWVTITTQ